MNGSRRVLRQILTGGIPLLLVAFFVFLSVAAPIIWDHAASVTDVAASNRGPSAKNWLGTDELGRDILARTLVATRASVVLAALATVLGGCLGTALGLLSGLPNRFGRVLAAAVNILIAFPALLLAIFFAVLFGIGSLGSVLAVGAAFTPGFARLTQTLTASTISREYVQAARVLGKNPVYILGRHILPNIAEPLILYTTIHIGTAIISLSGLSFLGLGVQPPAYDWGRLLSNGLTLVYTTPSVALAPAVAIVLAGITFNLAGERLADLIGGRSYRVVADREPAAPPPPTTSLATASQTWSEDLLLEVRDLRVRLLGSGGWVTPVREVSMTLAPRETLGIVGESGSGKSMAAAAIARLIEAPGRVRATTLRFKDVDLLAPPTKTSDHELGRRMAMIFQDPGESLNPAIRIGTQLIEPAVIHLGEPKKQARQKALDALKAVAIRDPARRYRQHQHELSGGMKQRVSIAIGLMGEPELLIADEPTTALDVTVQQQIIRLIADVSDEREAGILFISHDIALVSEICDRVMVMYAGFVVEEAPTAAIIAAPAHPYTAMLLAASPHMEIDREAPMVALEGRMPGPDADLPGCYFASRCPRATALCIEKRPPLDEVADRHRVACWHPVKAGESIEPEKVDA